MAHLPEILALEKQLDSLRNILLAIADYKLAKYNGVVRLPSFDDGFLSQTETQVQTLIQTLQKYKDDLR